MMYTVKRMIAFLLVMVMAFNIMPMSAFAGEMKTSEFEGSLEEHARNSKGGTRSAGYTVNVDIDPSFSYNKKLYLVFKNTRQVVQDQWYSYYTDDYAVQEIEYNSGKSFGFSSSAQTFSAKGNHMNTGSEGSAVFLATGPSWNTNGSMSTNDIMHNAGNCTIYDDGSSIGTFPVSIVQSGDDFTVTIGQITSVTYTATISGVPDNLTESQYAIIARVGDTYYKAPIDYNGDLYFYIEGQNQHVSLPAKADDFRLVNNQSGTYQSLYSSNVVDCIVANDSSSYFVNMPERDTSTNEYQHNNGVYAFTVEPRSTCSAKLVDTEGNVNTGDLNSYYVVALQNGTPVAFATAASGIENTKLQFNTAIYNNTTFEIVKYTGDNPSAATLHAQGSKITASGGMIDGDSLQFTWDDEPVNKVYTINVAKITGNVTVDMEYHVNGSFEPANYYVSVGPLDGPYDAKNLKDNMPNSAAYGFNVPNECLSSHYFLAFRTANDLNDAKQRGSFDVTVFYFASDEQTIGGTTQFENGRYTVTWSRIGTHHYKLVISEAHTVIMTVANDAPTDNLWIVFYQNQTKNETNYDYYAFQQYQSGKTTYTLNQLFVASNQSITTPYDPTKPLTVYLIRGKDGNYNINEIYLWNEGYRYVNGSEYADEYEVTINPATAQANNFTTNITIEPMTPPSYKVALRFYELNEDDPTANVALTDGNYMLEASDGSNFYTASLTGSSEDISFANVPENWATEVLPTITSWTFLKDGSETELLGTYEIASTTPETERGADNSQRTYVFEARAPRQYTVAVEFRDANGNKINSVSLNDEYTLAAAVKGGELTNTVSTSGVLGDNWSNSTQYIPRASAFQFRDSNGDPVEGKLENYLITFPSDMDPVNDTYLIILQEPKACTVSVNILAGATLDAAYDYYIVAKRGGTAYAYAGFTDSATNLEFTAITRSGPEIDEETEFEVVRVATGTPVSDGTAFENAADKVTASGGVIGDNKVTWEKEDGETPNFAFTIMDNQVLPEGAFHEVRVNLYDQSGSALSQTVATDLAGKKYTVRLYLYEKNYENGSNGKLVGYQESSWIAPENLQGAVVDFYNLDFEGVGTSGDGNYWETHTPVTYNPYQYNVYARLMEGDAQSSGHGINGGLTDVISGYMFKGDEGNVTVGDITTLNLKKAYPAEYRVVVQKGEGVDLSGVGTMYLYAEAKHRNSQDYYYDWDLASHFSGTGEDEYTKVIYSSATDPVTSAWLNNNPDVFSGNETTKARLRTSQNQSGELASGTYLKNGENIYFVTYPAQDVSDDTTDPDNPKTVYTDYVKIEKLEFDPALSYSTILGPGQYFGITANEFNHTGHLQSNFAVNLYHGQNNNSTAVQPDMANETGTVVAAHIDGTMFMNVGQDTTCLVYTDPADQLKVTGNGDHPVVPVAAKTISNAIVDPIINHGSSMSARLAAHEPTFEPNISDINPKIDLTIFPNDATIYLDGDALASKIGKQNGELTINKRPGQTVVINYKNSESVRVDQVHWQIDGRVAAMADQNIAEHVVYNMPNAKNVILNEAVGMFLIPREDSTTTITTSSEGWLITGGTLNQQKSGDEWHFRSTHMIDATDVNLVFEKKVDGKNPKSTEGFEFDLQKWIPNDDHSGADEYWEPFATLTNNGPTISRTVGVNDGRLFKVSEKAKTGYITDTNEYYALVRYIYNNDNPPKEIAAYVEYYYTFEEAFNTFTTEPVGTGEGAVSRIAFSNTKIVNNDAENDQVTIHKKDHRNKRIAEAHFGIYDNDQGTGTPIKTFEAGTVEISTADAALQDLLPEVGGSVTLYVIETEAPTGYLKDDNPHELVISATDRTETIEGVETHIITYTMTIDGEEETTITNINLKSREIDLSGTKTWVDGGATHDNSEDVSLKLYRISARAGAQRETVRIEDPITFEWVDNTYKFEHLPLYEEYDEENEYLYTYSIEEDPVPAGYTSTRSGNNFTNTLTGETELNGTKVWMDGGAQSEEAVVTLTLHRTSAREGSSEEMFGEDQLPDGATIARDGDTFTITGLPRYDGDFEYTYDVTGEASAGNVTVSLGNTIKDANTVSLSGSTTIDGAASGHNNATEITLTLHQQSAKPGAGEVFYYQNGVPNGASLTWTGDNYKYSKLPKYDSEGYEYTYWVTETPVEGFEDPIYDNGTNKPTDKALDHGQIINRKTGETSLTGTKTWKDAGRTHDNETEITLALHRVSAKGGSLEDVDVAGPITFAWEDDTYTYDHLPQYDDEGYEYTYSVTEETYPEGFTSSVDGNNLINTRTGLVNLSGTKVWLDGGANHTNSSDVVLTLYQQSAKSGTSTVTYTGNSLPAGASFGWNGNSYTYSNLPKYDSDGYDYSYWVTEAPVEGYAEPEYNNGASNPTDKALNGGQIINRKTGTTSLSGTKTWVDGNAAHDNAEDVTLTLKRVSAKAGATEETVNVAPVWDGNTYTYAELPAYDAEGYAYTYSVEEAAISGYETSQAGNNFTNTKTGTTSLSGTKTWNDAGEVHDNETEIKLVLHRQSTKSGSPLEDYNAEPTWDGNTFTYEDLPQFDEEGYEYIYTVEETEYTTGYESTQDGNNLINTYKTDVDRKDDNVTVNKKDGEENLDGAEFTLYDGETVVKTYGGEGVHTFEISTTDLADAQLPAVGETKEFTLKETKAPDGYELSEDEYSVTITASESSDWNTDHTLYITTTTYEMKIENDDSKNVPNTKIIIEKTEHAYITIHKQDQFESPLDGATFKLYDDIACDDTNVVGTYYGGEFTVSTEDLTGHLPETDGETVTLYLYETDAPENYRKDTTKYPVEITVTISEPTFTAEENAFVITTTYSMAMNRLTDVNVRNIITGETELNGRKVWVDGNVTHNNEEDVELTLHQLSADPEAEEKTYTGNSLPGDGALFAWDEGSYKYSKLPAYDVKGYAYTYWVTETPVDDYAQPEYVNTAEGYTDETEKAYDGATITNRLTGETELNGTKVWVDGNATHTNEDDVELTLHQLSADPEAEEKTYTGTSLPDDDALFAWDEDSYKYSKLPAYDDKGYAYTYWVTETPVEDYAAPEYVNTADGHTDETEKAYNGATITNRLCGETELTGTKVWVDADNSATHANQTEVVLTLHQLSAKPEAAETTYTGTSLPGDESTFAWNGNSYHYGKLPEYDNEGYAYTYWVTETTVAGYGAPEYVNTAEGHTTDTEKAYDGATITNRQVLTSAMVQKIWKDDDNRDALRPATLRLELLADGTGTGRYVYLTEGNNWADKIGNLPKYNGSDEIEYSWQEPAVVGYNLTSTVKTGTLTILTNEHKPPKTQITVTKAWEGDGQGGTRPSSIYVQLFADGKAYRDPVKLEESSGWTYTWTDLYENACEAGVAHKIKYTVAETEVPQGYTVRITGNTSDGFVITNTRKNGCIVIEKEFDIQKPDAEPEEEEETTDISITKIWDDSNNKDGNRPKSITVRLFAGGEEVRTAELTETTGWKYTFKNLPKFVKGKPIHYSITEDPVEWYKTEINGFTIRNKYTPETTNVVVIKQWNDNNSEDRPDSVCVTLNNGISLILSEANGWTGVVSGLPTRVNGQPANYTWTEQSIIGYKLESVVTQGNVTTFTNKLWKEPDDEPGGETKKPGETIIFMDEYDTPLGIDVMINHVGDCFD